MKLEQSTNKNHVTNLTQHAITKPALHIIYNAHQTKVFQEFASKSSHEIWKACLYDYIDVAFHFPPVDDAWVDIEDICKPQILRYKGIK